MPIFFPAIAIVYHVGHSLPFACAMSDWLCARGCRAVVVNGSSPLVLPEVDLAIALGGDGTILGLARKLAGSAIPVLGVNHGHVGFLTAFDANNWQPGLEKLLLGHVRQKKCMSLVWELHRHGLAIATGIAINDLVLSRGCLARVVNLEIASNGQVWGLLRSDGLIVSTPLGSTGYNASAGGPLLVGSQALVCLTPVCPYMSQPVPMVFGADSVFDFRPVGSKDCFLTVDGQEGFEMTNSDFVRVRCWPDSVLLLGLQENFSEKLHKRALPLCNVICG